jgi:hypothetical protein
VWTVEVRHSGRKVNLPRDNPYFIAHEIRIKFTVRKAA